MMGDRNNKWIRKKNLKQNVYLEKPEMEELKRKTGTKGGNA